MTIKLSLSIVIVLLVNACTPSSKEDKLSTNMPAVAMKEIMRTYDNCVPDSTTCTYVRIEYPVYRDSGKAHINSIIRELARNSATGYISDDEKDVTMEYLAESFIDDFRDFRIDFPSYRFGWYLTIAMEIIYESSMLISLKIYSESYTGGAHPNSVTEFYVIDKKSGDRLGIDDLVSDKASFADKLEQRFREMNEMRQADSYADLGFYISDDQFVINDNIGLTDSTLLIHFNPYEIAPYSKGATTIEVSRAEVSEILLVH